MKIGDSIFPIFTNLTAALGKEIGAFGERNWVATVGWDTRSKKDINLVKTVRRWYRVMVTGLEKILTLQSSR
jgi:hypothetical protein